MATLPGRSQSDTLVIEPCERPDGSAYSDTRASPGQCLPPSPDPPPTLPLEYSYRDLLLCSGAVLPGDPDGPVIGMCEIDLGGRQEEIPQYWDRFGEVQEIGRASCRERVEISVGSASGKKKKKEAMNTLEKQIW